ncbi:MAG: hypothetical protein P8075_21360, partial [Deltaproteobacteria bacterium]
ALDQALYFFPPEVIPFLVPVMIQRSSPDIQQMVSEVIVHLSRRDIGPLEKLAEQHTTEMGDKLLVILSHLQGDRANNVLFKMCNHSPDKVRRKAIKELVDRDPQYVQKLFSLIDDSSQEIRNCILTAIKKHKSSELEKMLLNYLKENSTQKDPGHILACYLALGRCGSSLSVPFLSRILMNRGWNSFMGTGKLNFREGAAIALALLNIPEAKDVLQKASKSRFRVIKKALAKTNAMTVSGEKTNA